MPTMDLPALASEFPAATQAGWEALVGRVLKGGDFEKKLVGRTADGIRIAPLYPKADAPTPILRRAAQPWRVGQRIDHPDPKQAQALALADLEGGADALTLAFAGSRGARGFGLQASDVATLDAALGGVMLDLIELAVETAPFAGRDAVRLLSELAARRGHPPAALTLHLGLDPAGDLARTGRLPVPWPDLSRRFASVATEAADQGFGGTLARVDTRAYHEAGASEAQELGAALATGVAYLRAFEAGGLALETARIKLRFLLVADADQFLTVAKFRALRRLWARVETGCGVVPEPLQLGAETAWRMTTRRDPWVNLLRGTLAAFAAGIAGADTVTVLPFTAALGLPDAFARRLARNTQLLLLEEANLWRVADPSAGAGGFEALTDELVEAGWAAFTDIEREGGIVASLEAGALAARIAAVRAGRQAAVATRRRRIVGTSSYPHLAEQPVEVLLPFPAVEAPASGTPLPSLRDAEPFEMLRDRSDAVLAATGARPRVFLALLGTLADSSARATFGSNAFAAVGLETLASGPGLAGDALAAAFAASGAGIACLCGSDGTYARDAIAAAETLSRAGAAPIFLAGRPADLEEELRAAGVSRFLALGTDLPALLGDLV